MHKEQRQRHKTYWEGWGGGGGTLQKRERKDSGWIMKEAVLWQTQTFWLGKWHHLFLFSTSLSHIGSEIEKRKIAQAQSKNKRSLGLKKKSSQSSSSIDSSLKPLRRLILCLWTSIFFSPQIVSLTSKANLDLHLLPLYQISIGKPCWKTLKGTKKARLHRHISTSTICSLACSG